MIQVCCCVYVHVYVQIFLFAYIDEIIIILPQGLGGGGRGVEITEHPKKNATTCCTTCKLQLYITQHVKLQLYIIYI